MDKLSVKHKILEFIFEEPNPIIIGHNFLGFDSWVLWRDYGLKISVGPDTFSGLKCTYFDTIFASQYLLPDREGFHRLHEWGKYLGLHKIDYRTVALEKGIITEEENEFVRWSPDMDIYCMRDCEVAEQIYLLLSQQIEDEKSWSGFRLGQKNFWLMKAQAWSGFKFDIPKAEALKVRIEGMIKELKDEVEPQLPKRKLKKAEESQYRLPAKPFTKDGSYSALLKKKIEEYKAVVLPGGKQLKIENRIIDIAPHAFIIDELPMELDDQNALKDYFLNVLLWKPTMWNFKKGKDGRPVRDEKRQLIKTSPKIQENQQICPNLLELDGELPKKIVKFLSLRNRLGVLTGWLEDRRLQLDGRLSAGASGIASTHRMKHTTIVNVPKAQDDVLLGKEFRSLFTVEKGSKLIGCDQAALEARCEAHWVWKYPGGQERANTLISGDPHSQNAKVFFPNETRDFDINAPDFNKDHPGFKPYRSLAKNGGYCLPMHTEILTDKGWVKYDEVSLSDTVYSLDLRKNLITKDKVLEKHFVPDQEVFEYSNKLNSFECTEDHRWFGWKRCIRSNERVKEHEFFKMSDTTTEHNIIVAKEFTGGGKNVTPNEGALLGWILSEGTIAWSNKPNGTSSSHGIKKGVKCTISQAEHNFANELRKLLSDLNADYVEYSQKGHKNPIVCFSINPSWIRDFWDRVVGERVGKHEIDWVKWILSIPSETRKSLLHTFWMGDGQVKNWKSDSLLFSQNKGRISDAIQLGFFMEGRKVTIQPKYKTGGKGICQSITASYRNHITCQELSRESKGIQDTFCLTTNNGSFVIRQNGFIMLTGNCLAYGGQAAKLAQTLRKPAREAKPLYEAYWAANPSLKELKDKVEYAWQKQGQKVWIPGIDGRRLHSRSKHSLINLLFQSTGAIIVDYALALFDQKMGGLHMDLKGRPYYSYKKRVVKRVGYFHDEAIVEAEEDIAEEVARVLEWCMVEAGLRLKLNVPLVGESKIGLSWDQTH